MEGQQEDICKVCRLGRTPERPLFHPCRCTGSIRYVHQDCLMQWLGHSGKEYCELCHHKFQFASVYRHDMPRWIPLSDIYQSIVQNVSRKFGRWFHIAFVVFMWLFLVPVITYRIYKCILYDSLWSLMFLPFNIFTTDSLIFDSLLGIVIVALSLLGFISLVWLKDQLSNGDSPEWLVSDRNNARREEENSHTSRAEARKNAISTASSQNRIRQSKPERQQLNRDLKQLEARAKGEVSDLEESCWEWRYDQMASLRVREMTLLYDLGMSTIHYQPLLRRARFKNMEGVEGWRTRIFDRLRREGEIPPNVSGLPKPAAIAINKTPLPSLIDLGLTVEESAAFQLFNRLPCPPTSDEERSAMLQELHQVRSKLKDEAKGYTTHQAMLTNALTSSESESVDFSNLSEFDQTFVQDLRHVTVSMTEESNKEFRLIREANAEVRNLYPEAYVREDRWYERIFRRNQAAAQQIQQQQARQRRAQRDQQQQPPQQDRDPVQRQRMRRPNIGQALVGLAREPPDANAEAAQADQLMRMVGLDGSFRFLEHVIWLIVLVAILVLVFVYIPSTIGSFVAWAFSLWDKIGIKNWKTLSSVMFGYCVILIGVVSLYYLANAVKLLRFKPMLGVAYLALKICLLLLLEAGIFPLLCGWWIDICAFTLLGSNLKIREESLNSAPGTIMFLHWLAGMIFVFYFASLVVLLREVLRPGVLWFLRNLNDQNFHPIQDMIAQPFQRHMRRFLMSNIMFGVSIMVVILIPSHITAYLFPGFLPYNLTLISSVSPLREVQLELILLQFVIPTLLEHSNTRVAVKALVKHWSSFMAKYLNTIMLAKLIFISLALLQFCCFTVCVTVSDHVKKNAIATCNMEGYCPPIDHQIDCLNGLQSYLLDGPQTGGNVVDIHGKVIRTLEHDPNWEGPVYVGENQLLGAGYAPFKPYLRPKYFSLKVSILLVLLLSTIVSVSTFLLIAPIFMGRQLMLLIGIESPPDVYTAAIGLYLLWILVRVVSVFSGYSRRDISALLKHVFVWIIQGIKCIVAGFLLFIVIPLLLGHLVNLLIISPLRVPLHKTPIFYLSTEWALGLLHMKCTCGIIWLTDTSFKRTLDIMYQNGARNLKLFFIIKEVVWPVVCNLLLCLAIPYVLFMGVLKSMGLFSSVSCYALYRYCYPFVLMLLITLVVILIIFKQSHSIYTSIRNEKYLVGRQLMNYGSAPTFEVSTLSTPEEETGEQ